MLAEMNSPTFWVDLVQIMGINILLSGDNAVVIALASRSLPEKQRNMAVLGGSAAAIILRVFFCVIIVWLLEIPFLKLIGGLLLGLISTFTSQFIGPAFPNAMMFLILVLMLLIRPAGLLGNAFSGSR